MWVTEDWAGNRKFPNKEFESFEDAWDFLLAAFPDDDDTQEFEVVQVAKA